MFCDFCQCDDCKFGNNVLRHARTEDGRWICDVCYSFHLCTSGPNRNPYGPCSNLNCSHRPKLVTDWIKFGGPFVIICS
jgi:hypothetical protein